MSTPTPATGATPAVSAANPHPGLPARLLGVILSPQQTFARIAERPTWLGALAVVTLVVAGVNYAFLQTEVGRVALLDQQVRQMEAFGMTVTEAAYDEMQRNIGFAALLGGVGPLVMIPIVTLGLAGLLYGVFTVLGGGATFRQVAAVVTHSGAVSILQQLFLAPLNYIRESLSGATNLAIFLPFLDEGHIVSRFLGAIDLFIIWWLAVLAIGLSVVYRKHVSAVFWSFMGIYVVIALVIALVMRAMGGA
ncbi:MAG TPA: YIP1 family protein [Vicinamibacterales bacterium]